jgi:hypothetical protein
MTEPFYAPHQLAELQEGYYAVNRTYEQLLGEYLSLRPPAKPLMNMCSTWFRSQTWHAEALHRHQHRAADDRRAGGLADVERALIRTRTGERRAPRRRGTISAQKPMLTPIAASQCEVIQHRDKGRIHPGDARTYDVTKARFHA